LAEISAEAFEIAFRGHGFFPSMRSPRVFWIGSEGGAKLTALAAKVDETLARLDIPKEEHAFSAHVTLARGGGGRSGSPRGREKLGFQRLQEKLTALPVPEFGTMTAREFFLYQSQLGRGGSKYTKLAKFALH